MACGGAVWLPPHLCTCRVCRTSRCSVPHVALLRGSDRDGGASAHHAAYVAMAGDYGGIDGYFRARDRVEDIGATRTNYVAASILSHPKERVGVCAVVPHVSTGVAPHVHAHVRVPHVRVPHVRVPHLRVPYRDERVMHVRGVHPGVKSSGKGWEGSWSNTARRAVLGGGDSRWVG